MRADTRPLEQRVADTLNRAESRLDRTGDCWLWSGATSGKGYGTLTVRRSLDTRGKVKIYLHRAMYERYVGLIPDGMEIDHLCRVKRCVNPAHLEAVTRIENVQRWARTITHCPSGHPYDEENTYLTPRGMRRCMECNRVRARRQ